MILKYLYGKLKELLSHAGFIRYLKNTIWLFSEQTLRIIAGLLVGLWVARYLGPEKFGILSYVLAFYSIFVGISKLGLDGIMVRELVNNPDQRDNYMGTAFWLKFAAASVVILIIIIIFSLTPNDGIIKVYILIIASGLLFQSFEVVEYYFQSQVLAKIISICKVIQLSISSLVKIYLVLVMADLVWFVIVAFFDVITLAVSYYISYKMTVSISFFKIFKLSLAKRLLRSSMPMMLSTFSIAIYMQSDRIMIKYFMGNDSVGIYSAAVKLIEALYFIPLIITSSLFPAILTAKNESMEKYYNRLQMLYVLMVWMAIFLAIFISFSSEYIIRIMYGMQYAGSASVLSVYSWCLIFVFLSVANDKWFYAEDKGYLLVIKILSGAVTNIALNIVLIPSYGIIGASVSTLISFVVSVMVSDVFIKSVRPLFIMKIKAFFPLVILLSKDKKVQPRE